MTANMYRVGDYVYFETSSTSPYQIRRIEELNKTASGNVEAKVMCFYRRRDLPNPLIQLADKHQCALDESTSGASPASDSSRPAVATATAVTATTTAVPADTSGFSSKQRHQMKHRELFLSRQVDTLPATHIRGKCSVTLFNETESLQSYLNKDDMFFYCLVYDPTQKTLLADKGEIRVGSRYQSDVTNLLKEGESDGRSLSELETLVWTPEHGLSDRQIDQFLVVSRSVGTFARALDCSSSVKQPSLHMSAAAASRDITLFHAMDTLHKHGYDLSGALCSLVPSSGPVLCRDEMEEWSASEANLFEEALDKYGKDFNDIRQDFLPWKTLKNIIEYYYMWKTTDRYVQQKRVKAVEAESKLKQVYIPNYNKPNPAPLNNNKGVVNGSSNGNSEPVVSIGGKACESCNVTVSSQWYAWGPTHLQCRLCQTCWQYWKRYGGLKIPSRYGECEFDAVKKKSGSDGEEDKISSAPSHRPHRCNIGGCGKEFKLKAHLARHYATAHGIMVRSGSPRPIMKTRTAFYLCTTPLTRISRRLCRHIMRPRHASRAPFFAINIQAVKQECGLQMTGKSVPELKQLLIYRKKNRGSVTMIANRLGNPGGPTPQWLILTDKELLPKPEKVAYPKPPKAPDGSLLYERVPNKPEAEKIPLNNMSPSIKKRPYDEMNGGVDSPILAGPPPKRLSKDPMPISMTRPIVGDSYSSSMVSNIPTTQSLPRHIAQINGKPKIAHMTRTGSGRKQVISWMDAPDDLYFRATDSSKKMRKQIPTTELRRIARKPWRMAKSKEDLQVVVLD
ncbi:PREDICTED: metastasis-associated protein MTA3 isoform X2 [Nicrophorus vespilloides]|uniref:Metastasis-associated protein MTA3 isoform X2 n=1 Tax=Nicrophorus vespilloides TaxID=110193 RepID=A0ABM1N4H1_NICVS|nr:PREDICTED: metastasis-associated protein MTA3 isoform X2 [Nicrophorus vespilloides]